MREAVEHKGRHGSPDSRNGVKFAVDCCDIEVARP